VDAKEIRLALREAGFSPIPIGANSKAPCIGEWQTKQETTVDEVCSWPAGSTGILTKFTPTLDCDITHQEAAEAVREFVEEWFEDRGYLLIRFGQPPKFAVPFSTQNPFPKMAVCLHDSGKEYRVEFLGSGGGLPLMGALRKDRTTGSGRQPGYQCGHSATTSDTGSAYEVAPRGQDGPFESIRESSAQTSSNSKPCTHRSRLASSDWSMSALPPKADVLIVGINVCFVPKADIHAIGYN
jgi:hypothetical protein